MDDLIDFMYFLSEYKLIIKGNKPFVFDSLGNAVLLGDNWQIEFDAANDFVTINPNNFCTLLLTKPPFMSGCNGFDVLLIKDWLDYVGICTYNIGMTTILGIDTITVDDWEFKFINNKFISLTDLSAPQPQLRPSNQFIAYKPTYKPPNNNLSYINPLGGEFEKKECEPEEKAKAPTCTCGAKKCGSSMHSDWCDIKELD